MQGIEFDDIVVARGGGGTVTGLAIANYLCGSPYKWVFLKVLLKLGMCYAKTCF